MAERTTTTYDNGDAVNKGDDIGGLLAQIASNTKTEAASIGDATAGNQTTEIARLDSILAKILAAPATEAKQDAGNASLSVLDDWDESDRAKVNPIAGQAGVQGASGTVTALTQRVVLATDVGLPAGTANIGDVDVLTLPSVGYSASASFTPAAASHTAGDANGAAGTFASMGPSAGRIIITSASLEIDGATAEATAWRLYLFNITPPSAVADDGAFVLPSGDRASFLGYVDLGTAVDLVDTQYVEVNGINKQLKLAGTSVFAYLVNLTTVTPAAVAHIVTLHAVGV